MILTKTIPYESNSQISLSIFFLTVQRTRMQKDSIDDKEEGVCVPHPISYQSLVVLIYFQSKLNTMHVYCSGTPPYDHSVKGATSRFVHLEKLSLKCSSSSFRIRVNLRLIHTCSFLVYYHLFGVFLSYETIIVWFPSI